MMKEKYIVNDCEDSEEMYKHKKWITQINRIKKDIFPFCVFSYVKNVCN